MDGARRREVANVGVVGAFFVAGSLIGGPIGATIGGIAGEMAAGLTERGWVAVRDRFLGGDGLLEPDLQAAMRRAYLAAIGNLEQDWRDISQHDRGRGDDGAEGLFAGLRRDADFVLADENLRAVTTDAIVLTALGSGDLARQGIRAYLDSLLRLCGEGLQAFVHGRLENELAASFANDLLTDRDSNNRAWRAYQKLLLGALHAGIKTVQAGQQEVAGQVQQLAEVLRQWSDRLDAFDAAVREPTGEVALREWFEEVERRLEATMIKQGELTRTAIDASEERIVTEIGGVRAAVKALDRSPRTVDPDVLLRGPIEAFGMADQLAQAERADNKVDAANALFAIEERLDREGYPFHARLIRERRADALVAAGDVVAAYEVWLADAVGALDAGDPFIPAGAKRGLDDHAGSVGRSLSARATAVEALEQRYERPEAAIDQMKSALMILEETEDSWAPRVVCWFAETSIALSQVSDESMREILDFAARLAPVAEPPIAVRLRLAVAEQSDDWRSLTRDATASRLSPADAGLVLSRHGRWLALKAQPEEAIDAYRTGVEKLARAKLLGDCAGALRAVGLVQRVYTTDFQASQDSYELARTITGQSGRFVGGRNARSRGIEAMHSSTFPDALQALRRYLLEARLSGHLHNERDALMLLGDLNEGAGRTSLAAGRAQEAIQLWVAALNCYIQGGERKKALAIATELCSRGAVVDVDPLLYLSTPWIIEVALSVISACGDLIPPARVERIAERLTELSQGQPRGLMAPDIDTWAWKALAAVILQFPDARIDEVLDRLEPLVEREPGTHRARIDKNLLNILIRVYAFRREFRDRARDLLVRGLENPDLADMYTGFLAGEVADDEVLKQAVISKANDGQRWALHVLAASAIDHPRLSESAERAVECVLAHEVGIERNQSSITSMYEDVAQTATYLSNERRLEVARHLASIAADELTPESERSGAVQALGALADGLPADLRSELFDLVLPLTDAPPSTHILDLFAQSSLHPFSRFRFDLTGLSLGRTASWTAARLIDREDQLRRYTGVLHALFEQADAGDERAMTAGINALQAMKPELHPLTMAEDLARHPNPALRRLAAASWSESAAPSHDLGEQFAQDPAKVVRRKVATALPEVAAKDAPLAETLRARLVADPSAEVRAYAGRFGRQSMPADAESDDPSCGDG